MPQNFQNGKIYSIRSHQTEKIYIGSTTQPLHKRFHQHKSLNCSSKVIMKFDDAYIELVEMAPCANKIELQRREGEIIRTTVCVNKKIAGRTDAEYYEDHKEQTKQFYEDNKEEIKQYQKQYEKTLTEEQKQYRGQYTKRYRQAHKKIRKCSCGNEYNDGTTYRRNRHYGSDHHVEFVNNFYERLHQLLVPENE